MDEFVFYYNTIGKSGMLESELDVGTNDDYETASSLAVPGERVLDLACGFGRITSYLMKLGVDAYGIDISPVLIEAAVRDAKEFQLSGNAYKVGDMRFLPYESHYFDKVLCFWNSFTHLLTRDDQLACMKEIYRVLKPDGYSYLVLPDTEKEPWKSQLLTAQDQIVTWYRPFAGHDEPLKIRSFAHTRDTIGDIINQSGFKQFKIECRPLNNKSSMVVHLFK
ncbi:class I SAM-dependent methyltransferase [bacterium]|nr:class I SAM-dependent methyltransferase [bacterium]MBP9807466.1 class I SAM-dependent methyltransferase [bacterium]